MNHNTNWDELHLIVRDIHQEVSKEGKYRPTIIVGISRGGLVPAVMLSHLFDIPMVPLVWSTRQFVYRDAMKATSLRDEVLTNEQHILVVDDICDTGKTFSSLRDYLGLTRGIKYASIHKRYSSGFHPDYYGREVLDDNWVVYPYENIDNMSYY